MSDYIQIARFPLPLLFVITLASSALAAVKSESKPNIVLVLMGKFGWGEILDTIEKLELKENTIFIFTPDP